MGIRNGGWQVNIEYFNDYVIKTSKTRNEIERKVSKHLASKDELHKIQDTVDKIQSDWNSSIEMVKNSNIPLEHLAYPEFLEDETIKQRKVEVILDRLNLLLEENDIGGIKKLAKSIYEFIYILWSYGLNEKTYKLATEFGVLDNNIVLIDFGELSDNREKVNKQITEKKWSGLKYLPNHLNEEVGRIFSDTAEEMLTLDKLNEYWGVNIK